MNYSNHRRSFQNGGIYCFLLFLFLFPFAAAQSNQNQSQNYNKFSPSMAIIIVILIAALFLMGFFSVYIRHCSGSPSASIRNLTGGGGGRNSRGLDQAVIDTFPTLEYSVVKIHKLGKGTLECAVCLNEFEETEKLRLIPKCDHAFHPDCIDEWLSSHTTCPVCRANLVPQPGESVHGIPILDIEAQHEAQDQVQKDAVELEQQQQQDPQPQPQVLPLNQTLNRNRTRGSRSGRSRRFPRSHSTGHSLVQPGEDTERFTLRLPEEVRKKILQNPQLHRARSLVILPRETSSRRGYRTGEGSSRGGRLDRGFKSDRWIFTMAPPFLVRASSVRSPRVANNGGEGTSASAPLPPAPATVDSV